jgi:hypothetical protein
VVNGPLLAYIWYRDHVRRLYPDLQFREPTKTDVTWDDIVRDLIEGNLTDRPVYATDPKEEWKSWFSFVQDEDSLVYRVESDSAPTP